MIKPEYITPDAKYDVMRYLIAVRDDAELNAYAGNPPQSIESQIAGILNVLIDAGIVSPPCYALRKPDNGGLLTQHRVYTSRESANDAAPYRHNVEHWKGQTR